jgi:hypothetical protein
MVPKLSHLTRGLHHTVLALHAASQFVRQLPLRGDALDAMTDAQRSVWAADLRLSAGATLEALKSPQVAITVDVKLVGFDGDG